MFITALYLYKQKGLRFSLYSISLKVLTTKFFFNVQVFYLKSLHYL